MMFVHSYKCLLAGILLLYALTKSVNGVANIDITQPIARVSPSKGMPNEDSFGYSVVLHQVEQPTDFESAIQNTRYRPCC